MITSRLRYSIANAVTRGELENVAREVQTALTSTYETASRESINRILNHAVSTVPFYRSFRGKHFEDLPVVNKAVIRNQEDEFFQVDIPRGSLSSASTSGSTGTPFTAYFDKGKILRHRGGLVGTYRFMGANPYGPIVHSKFWPEMTRRDRIAFTLKGHLPYSGADYDLFTPERVVTWIRQRGGVTIMGYASYIESLMREFEERGIKFHPGEVQAVIGGSEPATSYLTRGAEQIFGVAPRMRYSNNEIGMLAVTGSDINTYHIDTSSFYVEILDEVSDTPVSPGEHGRIVVTDLYNKAMPFLRYDTGDLGRFPLDSEGLEQRGKLTDIVGRRLDVLVKGTEESPRKAHPLQITLGAMSEVDQVRQFQLKQHAIGKFTWILNAEKSEFLESRLRTILDERVGDILQCNFSYVDEIPVMASGKRQFFVNEIPNLSDLLD